MNQQCRCLTCEWEGVYEQLRRTPAGDVVCPDCWTDEIEYEVVE